MAHLSTTGIIMLSILAVVGGTMTGLFAGYMYQLGRKRFGRLIAIGLNLLFYVVPLWALLSLGKEDGLFWFYVWLSVFYYLGLLGSNFPPSSNKRQDAGYDPESR